MALYKRGRVYWVFFTVNGKQFRESTKTSNKRLATRIWEAKKLALLEARFFLPSSKVPRFRDFSQEFLNSIRNANTRKRYASSVKNLLTFFGNCPLSAISFDGIERFKSARLAAQVRGATVNRDLAVLRRELKIAAKQRLVPASLAVSIELLEERKERRRAHILTLEEEQKLLAVCPPHIRALVVLIVETGLRSRREALSLRWRDVHFGDKPGITIRESKSLAGIRTVPMSKRCATELLAWRDRQGPEVSEYVFAKPGDPSSHLVDVRVSWINSLKLAGLDYFWIYDLRHTFASRATAGNVHPIILADLMGHSNPNILHTYARPSEEMRRSAISMLEAHREAHSKLDSSSPQRNESAG